MPTAEFLVHDLPNGVRVAARRTQNGRLMVRFSKAFEADVDLENEREKLLYKEGDELVQQLVLSEEVAEYTIGLLAHLMGWLNEPEEVDEPV